MSICSAAFWQLPQAAESGFGTDKWLDNLPVPQSWVAFDVGNIKKATAALEFAGLQTAGCDAVPQFFLGHNSACLVIVH